MWNATYVLLLVIIFQADCERTISLLESKIPEMKEQIEKKKDNSQCDPEDTIHTTTPVYKQWETSLSFALRFIVALVCSH